MVPLSLVHMKVYFRFAICVCMGVANPTKICSLWSKSTLPLSLSISLFSRFEEKFLFQWFLKTKKEKEILVVVVVVVV